MRMLESAKLGTLAAIRTGAVCLNPFRRDPRRDQVAFAMQIRYPEAVNHIVRSSANHYRAVDWNVNLVGGVEYQTGVVVQVAHVPPPLIAGHLDDHSVLLVPEFRDRFARRDAQDKQSEQNYNG